MDTYIKDFGRISIQPINIDKIEQRYGGKYVGDFCLKDKYGNWIDTPFAIFYQPNPNFSLNHTNYFAIKVNYLTGQMIITKGDSAFSIAIPGLIANNGEIIYSRYKHDYVTSTDKSVWIDGGRDYCRFNGGLDKIVKLIIKADKLVIQHPFPK